MKDFCNNVLKSMSLSPWFVLDILFTAMLCFAFLGYGNFDIKMRLMVKGAFASLLIIYCLSAWHGLLIARRQGAMIKAWQAYGLTGAKTLVIVLFIVWCATRSVLSYP